MTGCIASSAKLNVLFTVQPNKAKTA